MPQLPPEFHTGRIEAYDAMLRGNTHEALSRIDNQWEIQRGDFLRHLKPNRLQLALGALSLDAAQFHLLSALELPPTSSLDAAMSAANRGLYYARELQDIPQTAEALSVKGLVHVAKGLVDSQGVNLVPEFTQAKGFIKETEQNLHCIGIHELPTAALLAIDIEARLNDWRGRRVTDSYFKQRVMELLRISRNNIQSKTQTDDRYDDIGLAV